MEGDTIPIPDDIQGKFLQHEQEIIDEFQRPGRILQKLLSARFLTIGQGRRVKAQKTREDQARALLGEIRKGSKKVLDGFIGALREDKQHILIDILTLERTDPARQKRKPNTDASNTKESSYPLSADSKNKLRECRSALVEHMNPDKVVPRLHDKRVISYKQKETILSGSERWRRVEMLLDVLSRNTQESFAIFLECLHEDKQDKLADLLEGKLTADDIQNYSTDFRRIYRDQLKKLHENDAVQANQLLNKALGASQTNDILYVNLSLAPKELLEAKHKEEYVMRAAENFQSWNDIQLEKIFNPLDVSDQTPRSVMLLGGAGMGKTTASHKMALRWARSEEGTDAIGAFYRFECRRFGRWISTREKLSLCELIFSLHGPTVRDESHKTMIIEDLDSPTTQILIDGMDELVGWAKVNEEDEPIVKDEFMKAEIPTLIFNLWKGHLLPRAKILFTSRPNDTVNLLDFDRVVVAMGFGYDSIRECIHTLCERDQEESENVMAHIEEKTHLYVHCIVPLFCVILGMHVRSGLKKTGGDSTKLGTLDRSTQLYIRGVAMVLQRRMQAKPTDAFQTFEKWKETLDKLMNLAALGMFEKESVCIVFNGDQLKEFGITEEDRKCGLIELTKEYRPQSFMDLESSVVEVASFIHLSFQEFFAAVHTALSWKEEVIERICTPVESRRYDMVLLYLAGLLGDEQGQKFLKALDPNQTTEGLTEKATQLFTAMKTHGEDKEGGFSKTTRLHIIRCLAEGRMIKRLPDLEPVILTELQGGVKKLDLLSTPGGLQPHHLAAIGFFLNHSTPVHTLDFDRNNLSTYGMEALSNSCKNLKSLREIRLRDNNLSGNAFVKLAPFLAQNSSMENLFIGGNNLGPDGARALASCENVKCLRVLRMGYNNLTDEGAISMAQLLDRNLGLEMIFLRGNLLTDAGAKTLSAALVNLGGLSILKVENNTIGDSGAAALADVIKECRVLRELSMQFNELSDVGATSIAKVLADNRSLRELILSGNTIGDEGVIRLASALKKNSSLSNLDLTENKITDVGIEELADTLRENQALQTVWIGDNKISQEKKQNLENEFEDRVWVYDQDT